MRRTVRPPPFPSHSHSHSHSQPNPIPLHCGAHGGAAVSITLAAPVVRIAEKSCDRTLSGRIDAVLPWWPRSCVAASNGLSWGKCDPGPKFLGGGADFKKLPTQHTSRQELLHALQPDHNSLLTSIRAMNHPDAFQQPYSPPSPACHAAGLRRCFCPRPGYSRLLVCSHIKSPSRSAMLGDPYYEKTLPSSPIHQSRPVSALGKV